MLAGDDNITLKAALIPGTTGSGSDTIRLTAHDSTQGKRNLYQQRRLAMILINADFTTGTNDILDYSDLLKDAALTTTAKIPSKSYTHH